MQFQSSINQQQMNQIGNQDRQISVLCTHNSIEIYNVLRHLIEYIIVEGITVDTLHCFVFEKIVFSIPMKK